MEMNGTKINADDIILITGANGFVGTRVVEKCLEYGFSKLKCFVLTGTDTAELKQIIQSAKIEHEVEIIEGNLLSLDDCRKATEGVTVVYHLAAGIDKSFPGAFMNSVLTTRNLMNSLLLNKNFKRFVNISSLAVYSNLKMKRGQVLDETCEIHDRPQSMGEAYVYAKVKQDELVIEYASKYHLPYVILRPAVVFGPGKKFIPSRVGIDTFGIFLHLGGSITVPLTYVENCAEAIVLAGIKPKIDGQVINIIDDNLPSSREFLKLYKKNVRNFKSLFIPYRAFYVLCALWEKYSRWSSGQLPPAFNRRKCAIYWKGNTYSNEKLKKLLGWNPRISFDEALQKYFNYQKECIEKR